MTDPEQVLWYVPSLPSTILRPPPVPLGLVSASYDREFLVRVEA